jgi:CheY-like chemotaxis protein
MEDPEKNRLPMNKSRILVVDDEQSIIDSYLQILKPKSSSAENKLIQAAASLFAGKKTEQEELPLQMGEDVYEVLTATNGLHAVNIVNESIQVNNPFSLIFLDMRMPPGIDGRETARQIRALDANVEIVIMTAYSDFTYTEIIEQIGTADRLLYLNKPFDALQISQLALSLTNRWLAEKELKQTTTQKLTEALKSEEKPSETMPFTVPEWIDYVETLDKNLKILADSIYEKKITVKNVDYLLYNQVRYNIRQYILRSLYNIQEKSEAEQAYYLKMMVSFNSLDDFNQMISHFFFVRDFRQAVPFEMTFFSDPYVQECFILSDLHKIQKSIEIIDWIIKFMAQGGSFKSQTLSDTEKLEVLKNCRQALQVSFSQCIKPEFQKSIYSEIGLHLITIESIKSRKEQKLEYSWKGDAKRERYSRFFLHLIFKTYMQTGTKTNQIELKYDLLQFEQIKSEFFTRWLISLGDNPAKIRVIKKIAAQKKLLLKQMLEEDLLKQLSLKEFDELIVEVNGNLPDHLKSPVEPLSIKQGIYKKIRDNLQEIKKAINRESDPDDDAKNLSKVFQTYCLASPPDLKMKITGFFRQFQYMAKRLNTEKFEIFNIQTTDFVFSDKIRMLIIIPQLYKALYGPLLVKATENITVDLIEIITDQQAIRQSLKGYQIVILLRTAHENFKDKRSDFTKSDVYDLQIEPKKVVTHLIQNWSKKTDLKQLKEIGQQIELEELESFTQMDLSDPFEIMEMEWKANYCSQLYHVIRKNISHTFQSFENLIQWIIVEGLIETGVHKVLTKATVLMSKILLVFPGINHLSEIMDQPPLIQGSWTIFGESDVMKYMDQYNISRLSPLEDLFTRFVSDKYDLVLMPDFLNITEGEFNLFIGFKKLSPLKKTLQLHIYRLNLYKVFGDKLLFDRGNHLLEKYDYFSPDDLLSESLYIKFAENIQQFFAHDECLMPGAKQFTDSPYDEMNKKVLLKNLMDRFKNRIELFVESYRVRH